MMLEAALLGLGVTTTKWIIKAWLGDSLPGAIAGDIPDLLNTAIKDGRSARAAERQFGAIADVIAERLEPYTTQKYRALDEAESNASILAVQATLNQAFQQATSLVEHDLDAERLEQFAKEQDPTAKQRSGLSEPGCELYDLLLSECCAYIAQIAPRIPSVADAITTQILVRETELIALAKEILSQTPSARVPHAWGKGAEVERFETRYRRAISDYADRIKLFGVDSRTARRSYSLSVAYISLRVDKKSASAPVSSPISSVMAAPTEVDEKRRFDRNKKVHSDDANVALPVETVLSSSDLTLVSGTAGSGKTTLLQWLTLNCAAGTFNGEMEKYNNAIPILIPLRFYANDDLPKPEDFLEPTTRNLTGSMPQGWVHTVLSEQRGLLLIDGLDELPADRRAEAHTWLGELLQTFPGNSVVVTSRVASITTVWKEDGSFTHAELLPMEREDIEAFVAHWHRAASKADGRADAPQLFAAHEHRLLSTVRSSTAILNLCTNPLLCALLCALNRDRSIGLPDNRMSLYSTALRMLVADRDVERRITIAPALVLDYGETAVLLREIALWLQDNNAADAELSAVVSTVARTLPRLSRGAEQADAVTDYLVQRSGVLRSPVPGRIDFVHRTFLEYLAAAALVEHDSIDRLVLEAHKDHWREVIILACGHANSVQRERLLASIIQRGETEPERRHVLYLLAVACLETASELNESLRARLHECLSDVIPPGNMTDAAAVASAGAFAVPLLSVRPSLATQAAACIRALAIVGGDAALNAIAQYESDSRVTVTRALIDAWRYFEPDEYAARVLAKSPLDRGQLTVKDISLLDHVHHLEMCEHIFVDAPGRLHDFTVLPSDSRIFGIDASYSEGIIDLWETRRFEGLERLFLDGSRGLRSLDGLPGGKSWTHLHFNSCVGLLNIDALAEADVIDSLSLLGTSVRNLNALSAGVVLGRLNLGGLPITSLPDGLRCQSLNISYCAELSEIASGALSHTSSLSIQGSAVRRASLPARVETLQVEVAPSFPEIEGGDGVGKLRLYPSYAESSLVDAVEFALQFPNLVEVSIYSSPDELPTLNRLSESASLRKINVTITHGAALRGVAFEPALDIATFARSRRLGVRTFELTR